MSEGRDAFRSEGWLRQDPDAGCDGGRCGAARWRLIAAGQYIRTPRRPEVTGVPASDAKARVGVRVPRGGVKGIPKSVRLDGRMYLG